MRFLSRRLVLVLPCLLAACAEDDEPPTPVRRDFRPLRYDYLPPIELNVQRLELSDNFTPPSDGSVTGSISIPETLFSLARDRLRPVGMEGSATFRILSGSIVRKRDTLNGVLAVRLDVRGVAGTGYAEARATATKTAQSGDQGDAAYEMLKSMLDDLNIELEFQIRNKLRAWTTTQQMPPLAPTPALPPVEGPISLSPRR